MVHVKGGFRSTGARKRNGPICWLDVMRCRMRRFAVVLEGMAEPLAAKITQEIAIPPSASAPVRPVTARSW